MQNMTWIPAFAGMTKFTGVLSIVFAVIGSGQLQAGDSCTGETDDLGSQVLAIHAAISNPESSAAMEAITELGTDSRYYTMVRGWLSQQLAGDRSILEASGDDPSPKIVARIEFLERAIRAIDLE